MRIELPKELEFIEQELKVFFDAMVYKLLRNSHKGKWENQSLETLASLLEGEVDELADAINRDNTTDILLEAVDCANFAMMMADVAIKGRGPFTKRVKIGSSMAFIEWLLTVDFDHCMPWPFRSRTGPNLEYGALSRGVSEYGRRAHRVLCVMAHGEPPTKRHEACHSCGFSLCVNRKHLYWGTKKQNEDDKKNHGTSVTSVKLTWDSVRTLRNERKMGIPCFTLAQKYGISLTSVSLIINNKTWKEKEE